LIGEQGPDGLTHRAVAERAGVSLSSTTYYFDSKEELFRDALALVAREEVERLERLVLALAPRALPAADWAREVAAFVVADLEADPARTVAFYELVLEAARNPALRPEVARWEEADLRLAAVGLRSAGSSAPETDAHLLVGAVTGLVLGQLVSPREDFEEAILRPALERLFAGLTSSRA
jgi:TetR/AcrR family transcriptional regulator, regulator of biofilm formation and stress response